MSGAPTHSAEHYLPASIRKWPSAALASVLTNWNAWPLRRAAARLCQGAAEPRPQREKSGVIAEIKKAFTSKGVLREDFDPAAIGAKLRTRRRCLSVSIDRCGFFFQGHDELSAGARGCVQSACHSQDFS